MFEERYHKDQPAVKEMAQRIADNSPQVSWILMIL